MPIAHPGRGTDIDKAQALLDAHKNVYGLDTVGVCDELIESNTLSGQDECDFFRRILGRGDEAFCSPEDHNELQKKYSKDFFEHLCGTDYGWKAFNERVAWLNENVVTSFWHREFCADNKIAMVKELAGITSYNPLTEAALAEVVAEDTLKYDTNLTTAAAEALGRIHTRFADIHNVPLGMTVGIRTFFKAIDHVIDNGGALRDTAAEALGKTGSEEIVSKLASRATTYLNPSAIKALGFVPKSSPARSLAENTLIDLLKERSYIPYSAAVALGNMQSQTAKPEFEKLLNSPDKDARAAAIYGLSRITADDVLSNALISKYEDVRIGALAFFTDSLNNGLYPILNVAISPNAFVERLVRVVQFDPANRMEAVNILTRIGRSNSIPTDFVPMEEALSPRAPVARKDQEIVTY